MVLDGGERVNFDSAGNRGHKMIERDIPKMGERFRHFKGNMYIVLCIAHHTETDEKFVIYRRLDDPNCETYCARPLDMFLSPVDKEKYPDAPQNYRFERIR